MKSVNVYAAVGLSLCVGIASYFAGDHFGYARGYQVAYTSEHSHYLFERKRADRFQRTIATHRRCVSNLAGSMPPVQSAGFAGIGETFQRFAAMYWGTVHCNERAGFGAITEKQFRRIIPFSKSS